MLTAWIRFSARFANSAKEGDQPPEDGKPFRGTQAVSVRGARVDDMPVEVDGGRRGQGVELGGFGREAAAKNAATSSPIRPCGR